jgi:hypothetical protein
MTFFVAKLPASGEHGTYNRSPECFFWTKPGPFSWKWQFGQGFTVPVGQRTRMLVDGQPVTDWVGADATALYPYSFSAPNGHHLAGAEAESLAGVEVMAKSFVVNTSDQPLSEQAPWVATTRFERTYINLPVAQFKVQYPGALPTPKTFPLKPRQILPYTEPLTSGKDAQNRSNKGKLWVRRIQQNVAAAMTRRFVQLPTGDVDIEPDQKYFYQSATSLGSIQVGTVPPSQTCRDGPRGVGTLGPVYKIIVRSGGNGAYFMETIGRLGLLKWDGTVITEGGWRIKPGELKAHAGIRSATYMYNNASADKRPEHQSFYDSKWEHFGKWDAVPGPKTFYEPWGFSVAQRRSDGSIDNRDGHEFWICDTLHHRILFADHWTAHSQAGFQPAHFPPVGYVQAPGPIGTTTMWPWGGRGDATPSEFFDEPWDCEVNPADGKLYWTNYGNGSICRADLDGSNPEVVIRTPINPTNAQLGISKRLDRGNEPSAVRAAWLVDGQVGVATCVRPQAMGFNSEGKLIWVERYTYAIRELDLTTMAVRTLATIIDTNGGSSSSGNNDCAMAIDVEGSCGPQDDIFVSCWSNSTDRRYSKDGLYRGQWAFTSGAKATSGPMDKCDAPGYAWGIGIGEGRIVFVGNAAGFQCWEVTKRLPTDPEMDTVKYQAGRMAYYATGKALLHGPEGQGELGYSTMEEWGSWSDTTLRAFASSLGMPTASHDNFIYWVRQSTVDYDYSAAPDTTAPAAPLHPLSYTVQRT